MEKGPTFKTTNLLFFKKAEASISLGYSTMKVRGRSIFGKPSYEVLVEEPSGGETIKAKGNFIDIVGALRKNQKAWHAAVKAIGQVAEALSDESRNVRKSFSMNELVCIAGLDVSREVDDLAKRTRLERAKVSAAISALEKKGVVSVKDFSGVSLTGIGEGIQRFLSDDPIFNRIAAMLDQKSERPPEGKK